VILARQKHYAQARQALANAPEPQTVSRRIAYHRLKAAIASGLGEAGSAAAEMHIALALAPEDAALLLAASAAELQAGLLDDALQHAQSAGSSAVAQGLIGDIREKRGDYLEAAKAYQAAVALDPGNERYRVALALELVEHHTFEPAITVLEQAEPLFPRSARIRTLLGVAHFAVRHFDRAEEALTEAIALDPALEPAYRYLGEVTLESPTPPSEAALKALCSRGAVVCSVLRYRSAVQADDRPAQERAIAALKLAPPTDPLARCELGRIYQGAEQFTDARREMEACVRLAPTPQNHYRLGIVYSRLGLLDLAHREMAARKEETDKMSEELDRRAQAIETFQYLVK
jgi:tetratricopeptide (TPR) repeat protein